MSKGDYKNGKKDGSWVNFNQDGTVNKEYAGTFKDGKKISD
jgi:antitoxin component YwqK of YwqJK toxin-antitoxin module